MKTKRFPKNGADKFILGGKEANTPKASSIPRPAKRNQMEAEAEKESQSSSPSSLMSSSTSPSSSSTRSPCAAAHLSESSHHSSQSRSHDSKDSSGATKSHSPSSSASQHSSEMPSDVKHEEVIEGTKQMLSDIMAAYHELFNKGQLIPSSDFAVDDDAEKDDGLVENEIDPQVGTPGKVPDKRKEITSSPDEFFASMDKSNSLHQRFRFFHEAECTRCGMIGHMVDQCKLDESDSIAEVCFQCRQPGHFSRDCTVMLCRRCGKPGHMQYECNERTPKKQRRIFKRDPELELHCFVCGSTTHDICGMERPNKMIKSCCNCGVRGHTRLECKKPNMDEVHNVVSTLKKMDDIFQRFHVRRKAIKRGRPEAKTAVDSGDQEDETQVTERGKEMKVGKEAEDAEERKNQERLRMVLEYVWSEAGRQNRRPESNSRNASLGPNAHHSSPAQQWQQHQQMQTPPQIHQQQQTFHRSTAPPSSGMFNTQPGFAGGANIQYPYPPSFVATPSAIRFNPMMMQNPLQHIQALRANLSPNLASRLGPMGGPGLPPNQFAGNRGRGRGRGGQGGYH